MYEIAFSFPTRGGLKLYFRVTWYVITDNRNGSTVRFGNALVTVCRGSHTRGCILIGDSILDLLIHRSIWLQYGSNLVIGVCVDFTVIWNNVLLSLSFLFVRSTVFGLSTMEATVGFQYYLAIWMCQCSLFVGQDKLVEVVSHLAVVPRPHRLIHICWLVVGKLLFLCFVSFSFRLGVPIGYN